MSGMKVAFLGGGRMGEALLSGLIRSGGRATDDLMVTARREDRARELGERLGVATTLSNPEAVRWANTIVLTVKPQDMEVLLEQISEDVTADHVVVSFAAGIRTSFIERFMPPQTPVVRVMSNVPVLVDEAMSVISPGRHAEDKHLGIAEELLSSVGRVVRLPEKHQVAATATSPMRRPDDGTGRPAQGPVGARPGAKEEGPREAQERRTRHRQEELLVSPSLYCGLSRDRKEPPMFPLVKGKVTRQAHVGLP